MKVLILANNDVGLYKFRKELISELLHPGSYLENRTAEPCEVFISLPNGGFVSELVDMGCVFIDTPLERHGTNPIAELKLKNTFSVSRCCKSSHFMRYCLHFLYIFS